MTIKTQHMTKGQSTISVVRDASDAVAYNWDTAYELTTPGSLLASWSNADVLKFSIDKDGGLAQVSGVTNGFYGAAPVAQATNIVDPTGGATVDAESRTAISAVITALEALGLTAA